LTITGQKDALRDKIKTLKENLNKINNATSEVRHMLTNLHQERNTIRTQLDNNNKSEFISVTKAEKEIK